MVSFYSGYSKELILFSRLSGHGSNLYSRATTFSPMLPPIPHSEGSDRFTRRI